MKFRPHHPQHIAAAKAGFSERTARRMETNRHLAAPPTAIECRQEGPKSERNRIGVLRMPVVDEEVPQRNQLSNRENCPPALEHIQATGHGVNRK